MERSQVEEAARILHASWLGKTTIDELPQACRPKSLDEGYEIQSALNDGAVIRGADGQEISVQEALESMPEGGEVLFQVGGLKYRMPGKRQRVFLGGTVIVLNALLVIAVIVYFSNPAFQEFIYNIGRD